MLVLSRKSQESFLVEVPGPWAQDAPTQVVLAVRRSGDKVERDRAANRLLHVVVADDNRDTADSFSMLVKIWGHDVRVAYNGAAALEVTAGYLPDVMLLDLAMPGMDGFRLAQELRGQTRFKNTLLIAITGYAGKAYRRLCAEAGFDHYLIKPVELSTLEKLLLLERIRLRRSSTTAEQTNGNDGNDHFHSG